MFKPKESSQSEYEFVSIDELVPDDHLLRLIDKYINFSFLLEKVRLYYSDVIERPTDPLILFKMMFIGYTYVSLSKYKKDCNTLSKVRKSVLQSFRLICPLLIGAEGTRLLRDREVTGDPAGVAPRRLQDLPAESE